MTVRVDIPRCVHYLQRQRDNEALPRHSRERAAKALRWMLDHPGYVPRFVLKASGAKFAESVARRLGCVICGATAEYRVGPSGFCRAHKKEHQELRQQAAAAVERKRVAQDQERKFELEPQHVPFNRGREKARRGGLRAYATPRGRRGGRRRR